MSGAGGLGFWAQAACTPRCCETKSTRFKPPRQASPSPSTCRCSTPPWKSTWPASSNSGCPLCSPAPANPRTWTTHLQQHGIKVVHVVSSVKFALKAQDAGVDAVVAEGFEAGGHNGREETTTMCLVPAVADACDIPVIAAGGLHDGRSILAAMMLGAEGAQLDLGLWPPQRVQRTRPSSRPCWMPARVRRAWS